VSQVDFLKQVVKFKLGTRATAFGEDDLRRLTGSLERTRENDFRSILLQVLRGFESRGPALLGQNRFVRGTLTPSFLVKRAFAVAQKEHARPSRLS
jgi:hypothetical protein